MQYGEMEPSNVVSLENFNKSVDFRCASDDES